MFWSDGVEITADDIVYGIETTIKYPGMAYHDQFNLYVDEVYKSDNYTVVFELKNPTHGFMQISLTGGVHGDLFRNIYLKKTKDPVSFDFNPPVSSGPYVLKDYDQAGYWTLWERREDWQKNSYRNDVWNAYSYLCTCLLLWRRNEPDNCSKQS